MKILGLGGLDHNGSATLVVEESVEIFLEAERVIRQKNVGLCNVQTVECLIDAMGIDGVDRVAIADRTFWQQRRSWLEPWITKRFGPVVIDVWHHHDCHMQAAMVASPWPEALCISVDGKGDELSASVSVANRKGVQRRILEVPSAHSVGRFWWAVSEYCGLPGYHSAGKTMALAAYGKPRQLFREHLALSTDGGFRFEPVNLHPDTFRQVPRIVCWLEQSFESPAGSLCPDAAASVQQMTEDVLAHLVSCSVSKANLRRVCLGGGVALNGLANQALVEKKIVDELYVAPCTDDRGLSLGAAALTAGFVGEPIADRGRALSPFLGPKPKRSEMPPEWEAVPSERGNAVERLLRGEVLAWFGGKDEAGPRALGHRSLLATPTLPRMREHLNGTVKKREWFRPYGCSVKAEKMREWFELEGDSPYMLRIAKVRKERAEQIPSLVHSDGTCRPQSVAKGDASGLWPLLDALESRGHPPLLINTSLNGPAEPMPHTLQEALGIANRLGITTFALEGVLYERKPLLFCYSISGARVRCFASGFFGNRSATNGRWCESRHVKCLSNSSNSVYPRSPDRAAACS